MLLILHGYVMHWHRKIIKDMYVWPSTNTGHLDADP